MKSSLIKSLAIFFFALSLAGCATARKQNDLEIQGLRNQISVLEAQVQSKDDEINSLRASQESQPIGVSKKKVASEVKSRPNVRQIQTALQNAGFDPGTIDGRMGKQTRDAIRAFQRANDLAADGNVGKQTWNLLKEYLNKKVK